MLKINGYEFSLLFIMSLDGIKEFSILKIDNEEIFLEFSLVTISYYGGNVFLYLFGKKIGSYKL